MDAFDTRLVLAAQRFARRAALRNEEYGDLLALLLEYRCDDGDGATWLSSVIATACMGDNHLWQDLGLSHRQEVSELLLAYFPALYALNSGNMKWKKFFYKQLCERAEVRTCRAPSCAVCDDYFQCFEPE